MIFDCGFTLDASVELFTRASVVRLESYPPETRWDGAPITACFQSFSDNSSVHLVDKLWKRQTKEAETHVLLILPNEVVSPGKMVLTRYISLHPLTIQIS